MARIVCRFVYDGEAVAKGRPKFARQGAFVRTYTPKKTETYETAIGMYARMAMRDAGEPLAAEEAVTVDIMVERKPPKSWSKKKAAAAMGQPITGKPDPDNLIKAILDGLNGVAFLDDAQVAGLTFFRRWTDSDRVTVEVRALAGEAA